MGCASQRISSGGSKRDPLPSAIGLIVSMSALAARASASASALARTRFIASVLEDSHAPVFADGQAPAGISVHVLPKPLEMQRVFRAVADALGVD